jgi:hypothetical protein
MSEWKMLWTGFPEDRDKPSGSVTSNITKEDTRHGKWLSSVMLRRVVWYEMIDTSEVLAASIIKVMRKQ